MDIPAEVIRTLKLHIVFLKFSKNKDILIYFQKKKKGENTLRINFFFTVTLSQVNTVRSSAN